MGTIKSGSYTNNLSIDSNKACRVVPYDQLGNCRGGKWTYRAASEGSFTFASNTFFALYGSPTKTIIVQNITVSGKAQATLNLNDFVIVARASVAIATNGVPVVLDKVPMDSKAPTSSASLCQVYTTSPTSILSANLTYLRQQSILTQDTTPGANARLGVMSFDFKSKNSENSGAYLRGTSEGLIMTTYNGTTNVISVQVTWTEE